MDSFSAHKTPHLHNDCLPYLIKISQQCSKLNSEQFTGILKEFVNEIGISPLISIIFNGLYNISNDEKYKWISFLNDKISDDDVVDTNNDTFSSILELHTDALASICQFLTIKELSKLEQCNAFLLGLVRNTPFCITTLNYPQWQSFWVQSNLQKIHRLSNAKQLFLMHRYKRSRYENIDGIINKLAPIAQNITHLSADDATIFTQCHFPSLQSLTTFRISVDHIVPHINIKSLSSLRLNNYRHLTPHISSDSMKVLLSTQLKVLTFDVDDKYNLSQYRPGGSWHGHSSRDYHEPEYWVSNPALWEHFEHFHYDKGVGNVPGTDTNSFNWGAPQGPTDNDVDPDVRSKRDVILALCRGIVKHCDKLKIFGLVNMTKSDYKVIFGESGNNTEWNCDKLQEITLHISCTRICELLRCIVDHKPGLHKIDLLLWNEQIMKETDNEENGFQILNILRDLLSDQFKNGPKLRDIKLKS